MKRTYLSKKLAAICVLMAIMATLFSGCAVESTASSVSSAKNYTEPSQSVIPETPAAPDVVETETSPAPAPTENDPGQELDPYVASSEPDVPTTPMNSIDAVAAIGDLVGNYSQFAMLDYATVDIDNAHNPYDLTWQYGEEPDKDMWFDDQAELMTSPEWSAFYDSYVDACDWDLVFDADYYMSAFPMLAYLYEYDEDLLLEHFQTVGIHEGRQAIDSFNVSAYAENCGAEIQDAFDNDWECYYFYYMLNQDTESDVVTAGKDYPTWIDVELTYYQQAEFDKVNEFRAEVDVDPITINPEMNAFASYRAYHDAVLAIPHHDSINEPDVRECMSIVGIAHYGENTYKCHSGGLTIMKRPYSAYRNSEAHYNAMIADKYLYFGTSNTYMSSQTSKTLTQFDLFTTYTPTTAH